MNVFSKQLSQITAPKAATKKTRLEKIYEDTPYYSSGLERNVQPVKDYQTQNQHMSAILKTDIPLD